MKVAKDLMTSAPYIVKSSSEIAHELKAFLEKEITSAPVVSSMGEPLGMITELILIQVYLKSQIQGDKTDNKVIHHKSSLDAAYFVEEDTTINEVIKSM